MSRGSPRVVVAGDALIDMIMTRDAQFTPVPGGGPYNAARTLARLGTSVAFLGRLSDDWFGRQLRAGLDEAGVDMDLVADTADPTTLALAEIDESGASSYRFYFDGTSVPGLTAAEARLALDPYPQALHVGTLGLALEPIADVLASIVASVSAATLVMVDPNCRPSVVSDYGGFVARMKRVLARADIVKVSTEDLEFLALAETTEAAVQAILDGGAGVVLVTDGAEPVRVVWGGGSFDLPVEAVEVVDSIGAGDAFGGGFLARWLELGLGRAELADEERLRDAVRFGIRASAITCERAGADPPLRAEIAFS